MSAAIAASFSSSNITALILADAAPSSTNSSPPASDATGGSNNDDRGAATNVQLSDSVKATLAKAKADQALADQLQKPGRGTANRWHRKPVASRRWLED